MLPKYLNIHTYVYCFKVCNRKVFNSKNAVERLMIIIYWSSFCNYLYYKFYRRYDCTIVNKPGQNLFEIYLRQIL